MGWTDIADFALDALFGFQTANNIKDNIEYLKDTIFGINTSTNRVGSFTQTDGSTIAHSGGLVRLGNPSGATTPGLKIGGGSQLASRMVELENMNGNDVLRLEVNSSGDPGLELYTNGGGLGFNVEMGSYRASLGPLTLTSGNRFFQFGNSSSPPATPTSSGCLYSASGAGTWKGSSGTTTTFGPAGPHCAKCGYDFWSKCYVNTKWKAYIRECGWCGKVYKRGPKSVLGKLTREERKEILGGRKSRHR